MTIQPYLIALLQSGFDVRTRLPRLWSFDCNIRKRGFRASGANV
jgi:hypothetical protein